jgi:dolichyl-diphosphooligosaccharide--protein glycosyltransferase
MSVLAAAIHAVTPFSLNWIGVVLPAALGSLLAIPLYLLARRFGGPVMGIATALLGLLSPFYLHRSSVGWFDTDCLNLTFSVALAYCFFGFGAEPSRRRYGYLASGLVLCALFLWWWDQAPHAVTAIAAVPLGVALLVFYRPPRREGIWLFAGFGSLLLALLVVSGFDLPIRIVDQLLSTFGYVSKQTSLFPNIGVSISERALPNFRAVSTTAGSHLSLLLACGGLCWLVWRHPRESLFLGALVLLSAMSVLYAQRFLLFMVPVVALGLGFVVSEVWELRRRYRIAGPIAAVLMLALIWPAVSFNRKVTYWTPERIPVIDALELVRERTREDAVVWAWWEHGYSSVWWGRRATVNDGSVHFGERTVYTTYPLTETSYRAAANFIQFYSVRGLTGLRLLYRAAGEEARGYALAKQVLGAGPEDARSILVEAELTSVEAWTNVDEWLDFFFPPNSPPNYLLLDQHLIDITYWWFWFGSWDLEQGDGHHPTFVGYLSLDLKRDSIVGPSFNLDLASGNISRKGSRLQLSGITLRGGREMKTKTFPTTGPRFIWFQSMRIGVLYDEQIAASLFGRLFLHREQPPGYFEPIILNSPIIQLWRVSGDTR